MFRLAGLAGLARLACLAWTVAAASAMPLTAGAGASDGPVEVLLQVVINRVPQGEAVMLLRTPDGGLLVTGEELRHWRLRRPARADREVGGIEYFRLTSIEDARVSVDETRQVLELELPPQAFETTQRESPRVPASLAAAPDPGGFLTYDAVWLRTPDASTPAATLELGAFGRYGAGSTQALLGGPDRRGIRLDSVWSIDDPANTRTLRIGDAISRPAAGWGRALRFAGVQFGSNFATNPGLSLLPAQSVSGSAVVPSTVDVFVDNALVTQQEVPPGPFTIGGIPVTSGPGTLRVVVRDLLGREQVIEQPILGSALLLRPGLDDHSFEAGRLRRNYGTRSFDYGETFGAATWRRGLTGSLTAEGHLEASADRSVAGSIGAAFAVGTFGTASVTAVASRSDAGRGRSLAFTVQRPAGRMDAAVNLQYSTRDLWQLGLAPDERAPRLSASAIFGVPLGRAGALNLAYIHRSPYGDDAPAIRVATLGWSTVLARSIYVGASLRRSFGPASSTAAGVFINYLFDPRTNGSAFVEGSDDGAGGGRRSARNFALQRALPDGRGWGYRARSDGADTVEAGASYQDDAATFALDLADQRGAFSSRLAARGSLLWFGGRLFASRQLSDAFAVVRVADYPGVRVYNGNQWIATTDARGYAIVPRLLPYQENAISIDDRDLPIEAVVPELRKGAMPRYRAGVLLEFAVRREQAAELRVVAADGTPLPPGATARLEGSSRQFPVGMDGRLYLTGDGGTNRLRIDAGPLACSVTVTLDPTVDALPDLGTFTCAEHAP